MNLPLDHLPNRGAPDAPALVLAQRTLDYAALERSVGALAAWLGAHVPDAGARVASWLPKGLVSALLPLAAPRAGLVHVPINPLLKPDQVAHIMGDSGAAMLLTSAARADSLHADARARWADAALAEAAALDPAAPMLSPSAAAPDGLAALLYTSGSTGKPKGVMLSHANLALGADSVADYLGLRCDDRVLAVLPLAFDYGQNQLFSAWRAGAAVIPLDYLAPRDVIKAARTHAPTVLAGVPPLWVQLTAQDWPADAAAPLRLLTNSGGALTPRLIDAMRTAFPAADIVAMYGLTEAFRSTWLPPAELAAHPTSMGRAIPHAEVLVCRPDGCICADDEPGELVHCGPLVAQGYWQDAARTAQRFRPAPPASRYGGVAVWSGDSVRRDAAGRLYFIGRDDAMIKTAGNRVSPNEVEDAAIASGEVTEAVAFGVPDAALGAAIHLVVSGPGDPARLTHWLRARLPGFMQPARIIWQAALPRSANGKLDRTAIAAGHADQAGEAA